MAHILKYNEDGAMVYHRGNCVRSFGWYRDGGCVWRTVGEAPFTRNIIVSNSVISDRITAKGGLVDTAKHVAKLSGVAPENIQRR